MGRKFYGSIAKTVLPSKPKSAKKPSNSKPIPTKTKKVAKVNSKKTVKKVNKPAPVKKAQRVPTKSVKVNNDVKVSKKEKKPKAASAGPKGYTQDQYAKFKDFKAKFDKLSNQALKDMLSKNLQSKTGNKDDLVFKCADGATLGRIPRCPNCFGGRPRFDYQKGIYTCPGYRDDTDFHNCHSTFTKQEIKRDPWQN